MKSPSVGVLQSVERPEVAFSVAEPDQFGLHYEFALTEDEEKSIGVSRIEDIVVLLILRRNQADSGEQGIKANLMAPLVINVVKRMGLQKIIGCVGCDVTLRAAS
ncbi:MAG: flagellar biosynthesis protein FliW [Rhodocyclales bacterium]|nr:flagellar biosynthesis protein FliW [Rhodocyclales bacterium]